MSINSSTDEAYLKSVIEKHKLVRSKQISQAVKNLQVVIEKWASEFLVELFQFGSGIKGTALKGNHDFDFFISLSYDIPLTLSEIYESLFETLEKKHYKPLKQWASISVMIDGVKIDLVPGKRMPDNSGEHTIYCSTPDTWTKTNVESQVWKIKNSKRLSEIILMKRWRDCHNLKFGSYYLELVVIEALKNINYMLDLSESIETILEYLASDKFVDKKIRDVANSNNVVSDMLTDGEKKKIQKQAQESLKKASAKQVVW